MVDSKTKKPGKFLLDLDNADYLSIFDEFSDGVLVTNSKGVIVYYNQGQNYQNSQSSWNFKTAFVLQNQEI